MKPYVVTMYRPTNIRSVALFNARPNNTGRGHVNYTQPAQEWQGIIDASFNYDVYYFDGEQDANDWASRLLEEHPTANVIVSKSCKVYYRRPGPVESIEFSEKGLLPA